jgi:hypothetical protein
MDLFGEQMVSRYMSMIMKNHWKDTMGSGGQCLFTMNEDIMNEYKKLVQECCCDGTLGVVQLVN